MTTTTSYPLSGIRTYAFCDKQELVSYTIQHNTILVAINAEKIIRHDKRLKEIINNNTGYADGVGAVMALRKKGCKTAKKIPGVELWLEIVKSLYHTHSFYLIGSSTETIEATVKKLKSEFPGINLTGYRNGFFTEQEKETLKTELSVLKPKVVFVAMGSPKQEFLMEELFNIHPAIYQGLGGSFDVYAGNVKRAPAFFVNLGLEWFYRLIKQPFRFKRQIILIKFFWKYMFGNI